VLCPPRTRNAWSVLELSLCDLYARYRTVGALPRDSDGMLEALWRFVVA